MPPLRLGAGKWALLALSVAINLFLAGWIVAQQMAPFHRDRYAIPPEKVAEAIVADLPAGDGEILRHAIGIRMPQIKAAHQASDETMLKLKQAASAETVDPAGLKTSFDAMRATHQAERTLFTEAILEALPQMSQEGRRTFIRDLGRH